MKISFGNDSMAQRAIERGVGLDRTTQSRVEVSAMVSDFIAKNGVRRFEQGVSAEYAAIKQFLFDHGWNLCQQRNHFTLVRVGAKGRAPRTTWGKVMLKVDEIRSAKGLTPIVKRAA